MVENKATHGIYGVVITFITVMGGLIYQSKDSTSVVEQTDAVEIFRSEIQILKHDVLDTTKDVVQTELLVLKNENLEKETEELRKEWIQDSKITDLQRQTILNQQDIVEQKEQMDLNTELLIDINRKVSP